MKNAAAKLWLLFGSLWRSSEGVPTFTLGSTSGKSDQGTRLHKFINLEIMINFSYRTKYKKSLD